MTKRIGFFFDYDGVLAPITSSPSGGTPDPELMSIVKSLSSEHAVTVISGRDCRYLLERVSGLNGYACVYGLEIIAKGYVVVDEEAYLGVKPKYIEELASEITEKFGGEVGIIVGRTLQGVPLGMSIYWSLSNGKPKELEYITEKARSKGLVIYDVMKWGDYAEFMDIHIARRSKDEAVRILKTLLDVGKVIYFGDSHSDIPAFKEADVRVLVKHKYNNDLRVEADYIVNVSELAKWLVNHVKTLIV
ncbi:MAG: trehalose-phosphatase [Desulfurococcaceae archaeon TW002]